MVLLVKPVPQETQGYGVLMADQENQDQEVLLVRQGLEEKLERLEVLERQDHQGLEVHPEQLGHEENQEHQVTKQINI